MSVKPNTLDQLYAASDDPWHFRTSQYELEKFKHTLAAMPDTFYRCILEIGCGNGELARHLATRCQFYMGIEAVNKAIRAARVAVPSGMFYECYLPGNLPHIDPELIVLSEVLYFFDAAGISWLAEQCINQWSHASVLCVNFQGDTAHELSGITAQKLFTEALLRAGYRAREVKQTNSAFCICVLTPPVED